MRADSLPAEESKALIETEGGKRELSTRCKLGVIAFLVGAAIAALVIISFVQSAAPPPTPPPKSTFGFQDIFGRLRPTYSSVQWLQEDAEGRQAYVMWGDEGLTSFTLPNLTPKVIASYADLCEAGSPLKCQSSSLKTQPVEATGEADLLGLHKPHQFVPPPVAVANWTLNLPFTLSGDQRFVLLTTDVETVYRHSTLATYIMFDSQLKAFTILAEKQAKLNFAMWSPSLTQPKLAYVQKNDLYTFDALTKAVVRVTNNGVINRVINGMCDWVTEEEIFSHTEAVWWSPDGMFAAFLSFDEQDVPEINFPYFDMPDDGAYVYKYPKPGQNNSVVSLNVFSVASGNFITIDPNSINLLPTSYVVEVAWFGNATVAVKVMPRLQNEWVLWSIDAATGQSAPLLSAKHPQYLKAHQVLQYLPSTNEFVDIALVDGFDHLAVFSAVDGSLSRLLTEGEWEVQSVLGINRKAGWIFFSGTVLAPNQKAVYGANLRLTNVSDPVLLSCGSDLIGPRWDAAQFSPNGGYFVFHSYGENQPGSRLCAIDPTQGLSSTLVATLTNNSDLVTNLAKYSLPVREFVTIPAVAAGGNKTMRGQILYPANVLKDCGKQYPVLVHIYGGPGAQLVTSQFPIGSGTPGFHSYLSSSHNFIIFTIDPVGTGGMGDAYQKASTYGHLGLTEAEDIVGAVEWLKRQCYVARDRVALWGWSYGGFMASRITSLGPRSGLAATIAIAPVTDWKLYDSVYTERYMQTPELNEQGYDNTSIVERADQFSPLGPRYFLIHGTGDDNVHFQNAALLTQSLVDSNPSYEYSSFYYTNRAHSLVGPRGETNQHLYRTLTRFLLTALDLPGTVA